MGSELQAANELEEPRSVRFILAAKDFLHRAWPLVLLITAAIVAGLWLLSGIYTVEADETAAVLRFGRLTDDNVESGLHLRLPGIDVVDKEATAEVLRLEIKGDFEPKLNLLTADENLIDTTLVVQYRVRSLGEYLYATEAPQTLLEQVVRAALVESFASTPVDDVLTAAKAGIQNTVRERAQERLDEYGAGLAVVAVNLQSVDPPPEAAAAFRAVSDARAESARLVSEAEAKRERESRLASGEAEQTVREAESAAGTRLESARGAAERFAAILVQHRLAPEQTKVELYHAMVRRVLPRAKLVLLGPGEKPRIDVELIEGTTAFDPSRQPPFRPKKP